MERHIARESLKYWDMYRFYPVNIAGRIMFLPIWDGSVSPLRNESRMELYRSARIVV